ncbi:MAG: hypothetical protein IPJ48_02695 [Propionivibrio sp.]|uniref:Glycosyl transferase n=1 Tax=Candidatus Propionivibrio dominans TaxID=2954373 RepID=A0A9D7FHL1_9RHOO|nr:hypothetical protein [Candidatus Propionivibrio dominans]
MNNFLPHLFVDISSHGFGHLAQAAPVLNELTRLLPRLRLTLRSGLPPEILRASVHGDFTHIAQRSDFGFVMLDAVRIDAAATAAAYRAQHAHWAQRVADEAGQLARLQPDLLLSDVAYLPLAGAAQAGIRSLSMCSLNWADLFAHFFSAEAWAAPIHREILDAYNSAECFLRLTPGMPMSELGRVKPIAPVAALGRDCRDLLRERLACTSDEKVVLIAFGGVDKQVPVEQWPRSLGVRWLVPGKWCVDQPNVSTFEASGLAFPDLLRSVDAVLTKPGYGTFTEAACNGTPVLYLRRDDWPEQDFLIDWLKINARCCEIGAQALISGGLHEALDQVWQQAAPALPCPAGAAEVADLVSTLLEPAKK